MRKTAAVLAAFAALAVLASCGGDEPAADTRPATSATAATAPTAPRGQDDARAAVVAAYERLGSTSFRSTQEQTVRFEAESGPDELLSTFEALSGTTRSRTAAESEERLRSVVRTPQLDRPLTVVSYDGDIFLVIDPSDTRRLAGSLGDAFGRLAQIGGPELAAALEDVREEGPATLDGRPVRRYSAEVSQAFIDDLVGDALANSGVEPSQVDLDIRADRVVIDLRPSGDLARRAQALVSRIDLSRAVGEDAVIVQTSDTDQRFTDYGAPIVIEPPVASGEISDPVELGQALAE
jgi:hypothetical protein